MRFYKQLRKRGLALFMALVMCLSLVQVTAFADDELNANDAAGSDVVLSEDTAQPTEDGHEHVWDEGVTTPPADCVTDGETIYTCTAEGCGATKTEPVPAGHKSVVDVRVEPTETEPGLTEGSHCEICGAILTAQETIPATGAAMPAEVLAFLDAVAALPGASEVTAYNAEAVGEQVNAVLDLYEGLIDLGLDEAVGVAEALETVYAVFEAVLVAEEIDESDTLDSTPTSNVTKSGFSAFYPTTSKYNQVSGNSAESGYGTVVLTDENPTATDYLYTVYWGSYMGDAYYPISWDSLEIAPEYSMYYDSAVASATVSTGTYSNGRPCIVVNIEKGTKAGTTTIPIYYNLGKVRTVAGIDGTVYGAVSGYIFYTVTNGSGSTTVTPSEKPDAPNKSNTSTSIKVVVQCQDRGDTINHTAPANLFYDGETTIIPGEVVENPGTQFSATRYPYQCEVKLNGTFYVNKWNTALKAKLGEHYLVEAPKNITFYYDAQAEGWVCPKSALTQYPTGTNAYGQVTGYDYGWLVKIKKGTPASTTYTVKREYWLDGVNVATVSAGTFNAKVGDVIVGTTLAAQNPSWANKTVEETAHTFTYDSCNPTPSITLGTTAANNVITLKYVKQIPKKITSITKKLVESAIDAPSGVTDITYPTGTGTDKKVHIPQGGTVTLLYKITVKGDAGAKYTVTDNGATWVSGPNLNVENTIPTGGEAVIYVTRTFSANDITSAGKLENTATVTPGKDGESSSSSTETTPAEEAATTATYTVQWCDTADGKELKSETRSGTVGKTVSVSDDDKSYAGYTYAGDTHVGTVLSATLAESETVLKMFFTKNKPSAPSHQNVHDLIDAAVTVVCDTENKSNNSFGYTGKNTGRVTIGEVQGDATNGYTCEVTFLAQKFCDAYNGLSSKAHTLAQNQGNVTLTLTWDAQKSAWKLPVGFTAPVTIHVVCETDPAWTVNWMKGYAVEDWDSNWNPVITPDTDPVKTVKLNSKTTPAVPETAYPTNAEMQELRDDSKFTGWGTPVVDEANRIITITANWETTENININVYKSFDGVTSSMLLDDFRMDLTVTDLVTGTQLTTGAITKSSLTTNIEFNYVVEHGYKITAVESNYQIDGYTFVSNAIQESVTDAKPTPVYSEGLVSNSGGTCIFVNEYQKDSAPNLSITKAVSKASVKKGGELEYTITVQNNGTANATNVVVTDTLPKELGTNISSSNPSSYSSSVNNGQATFTWELGTIEAGQSKTVTFKATAVDCGKITNSANVTSTEVTTPVESDPVPTVIYNLIVTKKNDGFINGAPGSNGEDDGSGKAHVHYTVTVQNVSGFDLYGLDILDDLTTVVKADNESVNEGYVLTIENVKLGGSDATGMTAPVANGNATHSVVKVLDQSAAFTDQRTVTLTYDFVIENTGDKALSVELKNTATGGTWTSDGQNTPMKARARSAARSGGYDIEESASSGASMGSSGATGTVKPKGAAYKVEHYQENLDGTYTVKDTEDLRGTTGATATATAKTYEGFTENTTHADRVPSGTIAGDGSLVLKLYYSRAKDISYTVKYIEKDTNKVLHDEKTVNNQTFGATVTENAETISDYTVDAASKTLTLKAAGNEIVFVYSANKPNPPEKVLTVSANDVTTTYDGNTHPVTPVVTLDGAPVTDATVTVKYTDTAGNTISGDPVNAGNYAATITVIRDGLTAKTSATVTINKRSLIITANSASKVYDGYVLTNNGYTFGGDGLVGTDQNALTVTVTGSQLLVGWSYNVPQYTWSNAAIGNNYNVTLVNGTLTVNDYIYNPPVIDPGFVPSTPTPTPAPAPDTGTTITDEETPLAGSVGLNDTDHFAYVIGYEDDTVRPLNNITRAEAATIFFRLMTDEYRQANWSTTNSFSDVSAGDWYNNAVSTCANAGVLKGYEDGTFRPNAPITRAEFASMAAGFMDESITDDGTGDFSDTANHWAAVAIRRAAKAGWVTGNGNKFNPDAKITRAEVMTIVNRMLDRTPDAEHMLPTMKKWIDNPEDAWYYEAVQEATNEHDYERDDLNVETWTELLTERDWKALETEWANNGGASTPKADTENK